MLSQKQLQLTKEDHFSRRFLAVGSDAGNLWENGGNQLQISLVEVGSALGTTENRLCLSCKFLHTGGWYRCNFGEEMGGTSTPLSKVGVQYPPLLI